MYGQFQDDAEYAFAEGEIYASSNEYILICHHYSAKYLLAFLNSSVVKWLLGKITGNLGGNAKIGQKSNFIKPSIPILLTTEQKKFDRLVYSILSYKQQQFSTLDIENEINTLCYQAYHLLPEEINCIERD